MLACSLLMISSRLKELHCLLIIASALRHHMAACAAAMTRVDRSVQAARKALVKVLSQFEVEGVVQSEATSRWPRVRGPLRQELQVRPHRRRGHACRQPPWCTPAVTACPEAARPLLWYHACLHELAEERCGCPPPFDTLPCGLW